jgi:hypothetical protein
MSLPADETVVCASCQAVIDEETPHASIEITHAGNHWTPVSEPTVWVHASCLSDLELTISPETTAEAGDTDE